MEVDSTSQNARSFLAIMVRYFEPNSFLIRTSIFRLLNEHGKYITEKGDIFGRDGSGRGLLASLRHAIETPAFGDAPSNEGSLGSEAFRASCVELALDNGGGMIRGETSFYESVRRELNPDLPSPWDPCHHLHRLFDRATKESSICPLLTKVLVLLAVLSLSLALHQNVQLFWRKLALKLVRDYLIFSD